MQAMAEGGIHTSEYAAFAAEESRKEEEDKEKENEDPRENDHSRSG